MRQPNSPPVQKPGRSPDNPKQPLGEELLDPSKPSPETPEAGVYGRADVGAPYEGARQSGVAERAKVIAVLRKADEFMASDNPSATDRASVRRAIELAAGRIGFSLAEYEALVARDEELGELERKVIDNALIRQRGPHQA